MSRLSHRHWILLQSALLVLGASGTDFARAGEAAPAPVPVPTEEARVLDICPPNVNGTACSNVVCPTGGEVCSPRCVRMDPHGGITVLGCECRPASECHVVYDQQSTPFCSGNCPPAQYCVQSMIVTPDGDFDICCDCLPYQCECPGDVYESDVLDGRDIAGFVRCYLGQTTFVDKCGCADVNGDGYVSSLDVPIFVNMLLTKAQCPGTPCCPRQNLTLNLATGVDDSGNLIPVNTDDDDWVVTVDPSGFGSVPRPATVIAPHPSWLTIPGTQWVTAWYFGGNGDYEYEYCFCLDDRFKNPQLTLQIRTDDSGDVYLNGNHVGAAASFGAAQPATLSTSNPAHFQAGQNCIRIVVHNLGGAPTGFNMAGTITAQDGKCCCPSADLSRDMTSGVFDGSNGALIPFGQDDETWTLTAAASGGSLPRPPTVITPHPSWLTQPGSRWIGPFQGNAAAGLYNYEYCFCLDPRFKQPVLDLYLRADDLATVWLNGVQIGATPTSFAFNTPQPTHVFVTDPGLFRPCQNCVEIRVNNTNSGTATGLNVVGSVSAIDGLCCDDRTLTCCYLDGGCIELSPGQAQCPGGGEGLNVDCLPAQPCCVNNATICIVISPRCCGLMGGTVLPVGTPCTGTSQACCIPGPGGPCNTCINVDPGCCIGVYGGTPQGPGSSCIP
jgi:hypothetical protein